MSDSSEQRFDPAAVASAAGVAVWRATADGASIEVHSLGDVAPHRLQGRWTVDQFIRQFDGLHRAELAASLAGGRGQAGVELVVQLASGGSVMIRGALDPRERLCGVIVSPPAGADEIRPSDVEPFYQPIVRLRDGVTVGFECLARLRKSDGSFCAVDAGHPVLGIGPSMAREVGRRWRSTMGGSLFLNLNLSACELGDPSIVRDIADEIVAAGLPSRQFRVELTEQAAVRNWRGMYEAVGVLREAGAGIILDDFAAGHSSMVWLSELDVEGVKLDSSLLRNLHSERGRTILRGLLDLLGRLEVEVVVEGIEDRTIVPDLLGLGATLGQGYALGLPSEQPQIDGSNSSG